MTGRRYLGITLATVGALFVTASSYIHWFADRTAIDIPLHRLYETSVTADAGSYWRSVALPLAVVTALAVIGLILRSRIVFSIAWFVGAATVVLFIAMQYNDDAVDFAFADLQAGVWQAMIALGVMLVGIIIMGARPLPEPVPEEERRVPAETARRADEAAARADEAAGRAAEAAGRADAVAGRGEPGQTRTDTEHTESPGRVRRWWRGRRTERADDAEAESAEAETAEAERAETERADDAERR